MLPRGDPWEKQNRRRGEVGMNKHLMFIRVSFEAYNHLISERRGHRGALRNRPSVAGGPGASGAGRVPREPEPLAAQSPRARGAPGGWGRRRNVPRLRRRASARQGGGRVQSGGGGRARTDVPGAPQPSRPASPSCARPAPAMVAWIISRLVVLIFGTLYPAYYSYKAVKSKDIKEYVKWMMYWIIFALFTTAETFTDIFLCWFPFYYELKIAFVAWLLSPYTKGSSLLYRKFVHPTLSSKEKEIDDCLVQAKDRSYDALVHFGKRGLNVAATAAVMAASKVVRLFPFISSLDLREGQVTPLRGVTNFELIQSRREASSHLCLPAHGLDPSPVSLLPTPVCVHGQGALSERLRSFSMQDLSTIRGDGTPAPSGPPPPGPGRASGKHGQPKMSRSASESAGSSGTA
ncbi:hypothetical protein R6Z07M_004125 [Ovis aries]